MPAKYNQNQGNYAEHKLNQNIIFFSQSLHELFNFESAAAIFFSISQLYSTVFFIYDYWKKHG